MKIQLRAYYNEWIERFNNEDDFDDNVKKNAQSILSSVLKFADAEDLSDKLDEFVRFTKYLDKARKQSILDVAPQYKGLFDG